MKCISSDLSKEELDVDKMKQIKDDEMISSNDISLIQKWLLHQNLRITFTNIKKYFVEKKMNYSTNYIRLVYRELIIQNCVL